MKWKEWWKIQEQMGKNLELVEIYIYELTRYKGFDQQQEQLLQDLCRDIEQRILGLTERPKQLLKQEFQKALDGNIERETDKGTRSTGA